MSESVVSFLLKTLASVAVTEVSLLKNVGREINEIRAEFSSMQALLKDADAKECADEAVKEWVKQIRDVAYETEDVLDEFMLLQRQNIGQVLKYLKKRYQLVNRIHAIKMKVKGIASRKETYGLSSWEAGSSSRSTENTQSRSRNPQEDALFIEEAQLVGTDESKDLLIGWLVNDEPNSGLGILSVYGEGGLGKTTLVKKVFDSQNVLAHFPYRFWVTVSQAFKIESLLQNVIKQLLNEEEKKVFQDELQNMEPPQLKEMLQSRLRGKSYVVVLDDIWKLDAWKDLKTVFPDDIGCGSRIMVTTRYYHIARTCVFDKNYSFEFELPHLTSENSMKLFCKKLFASDDVKSCPMHLSEILQNFSRKCNGLPLAVISIAGLLQTKESAEWHRIYETLGYLMESNHEDLKDLSSILSLSYTDLPYHLKSCFLYLCIFPEDYSIDCRSLFRLWVAEGFIERRSAMSNGITEEDIAKSYLDELISRSLVQVEALGVTGRAKTCRIHDLMREFIIMKAYEQGFLVHLDGEELRDQMVGRRLSILSAKNLNILLERNRSLVSQLRSFIPFNYQGFSTITVPNLLSRFKLLRVLNLELVEFSTEIVKLFHLRYLNVRGSTVKAIPSSIGMLTNLEILIMKNCPVTQLPDEILRLKRLRYLSIGQVHKGVLFPVDIQQLEKLEHLSVVHADVQGSSELLKNLGTLTQMKKLVITDLKEEDGVQLLTSVEKMKCLHSLHVTSNLFGLGHLDMYHLSGPPPHLEKLFLEGPLYILPRWFPELHSLIKLTLVSSFIEEKAFLKGLERLPRLVELRLTEAFSEKELCFEKGGFPRLRLLKLRSLSKLNMVIVKEGAMPFIQKMKFINCEHLEKAPEGIECLTTLKSINARYMPQNFDDEIKRRVWKAGHNPVILCERL